MLILGLLNMISGLVLASLPAHPKNSFLDSELCAAVSFLSGCILTGLAFPSI